MVNTDKAEKEMYDRAISWLTEDSRCNKEIALKIVEAATTMHDLTIKYYKLDYKKQILNVMLRPTGTGYE